MPNEIIDCDGKGFLIKEDKRDINAPYWQLLYKDLTEDLKDEKYVKDIHKHSVKEINEMIDSGKMWCDDCGKPFELKLPQNYKELSDFSCHIINPNVCRICDDCHIECIKKGQIIGSVEDGWYPDKEKLLKEALEKHGTS